MRADRLISLTLMLQVKGRMTAQQLAQALEVSERTVYRDLDALTAAGIPVFTQSGPSGGIFLDEHYRLSLTGLSHHEVQALFVAGDIAPLHDLGIAKTNTLLKLFANLPSVHRVEVERLHQRYHIDAANWFQIVEPSPFFEMIRQAVAEDRQLEVCYQSVHGMPQERVLDAYALVAKSNIWYLVAKRPNESCDTMRIHRLARFQNVALTATHFDRAPNFDLTTYWRMACEQFEQRSRELSPTYPTLLHVHPDAFWYFPGYLEGLYQRVGEPDVAGWLTLRVTFQSQQEARARILGLGAQVDVLEPVELRQMVYETARAILERQAMFAPG